MAEVGVALGAGDFDTVHTVAEVVLAGDGGVGGWLVVAWPAGAGVELGLGVEQRFATARAVVNAGGFVVVVFTGEGALRAAHTADVELLVGELLAPGIQRFFKLVHGVTSSAEKSPSCTFSRAQATRMIAALL